MLLVILHLYYMMKTGTIAIFDAPTTLQQGGKYLKPDEIKTRLCYNMTMIVGNEKFSDIDDKGGVLYIESPFCSCGLADLNPVVKETITVKF